MPGRDFPQVNLNNRRAFRGIALEEYGMNPNLKIRVIINMDAQRHWLTLISQEAKSQGSIGMGGFCVGFGTPVIFGWCVS